MIKSTRLWHIIPIDLGVTFYDSTNSALIGDEKLYNVINFDVLDVDKNHYSSADVSSIKRLRGFVKNIKEKILSSTNPKIASAVFLEKFPGVDGCVACLKMGENLQVFICMNGTAVFLDYGTEKNVEDENYFSIQVFDERQRYEDEYCTNSDFSPLKELVYETADILWECVDRKTRTFSGSKFFQHHGVAYALCIAVIDIPLFSLDTMDIPIKKNCRALIETSAFNNIYDKTQWPSIKHKIDNDDYSDYQYMQLSETLICSDSWSGVVVVGDVSKNNHCLSWLVNFEVYLQSRWLLYEAISEDIMYNNNSNSIIALQKIKNMVELSKMKLDNDISSNMEQVQHSLRASLIKTSDIQLVYERMHAMLENQIKIGQMKDNAKKQKFSFVADASMFVIAVVQIYSVIHDFIEQKTLSRVDFFSLGIVVLISVIGILVMSKGR